MLYEKVEKVQIVLRSEKIYNRCESQCITNYISAPSVYPESETGNLKKKIKKGFHIFYTPIYKLAHI